jgi:methylenetetrahydrofolate reductase (NADPH)
MSEHEMFQQHHRIETSVERSTDRQAIVQLAREASIELNVQDLEEIEASRAFLPRGKRIYISHLPKQTWDETLAACSAVSAAGFDPIPHVPVRLLDSEATLNRFVERAVERGRVNEVLLIAGDSARVGGPYATVADVLRGDCLVRHGVRRVSLAGHPEGHPTVSLQEIRRAEGEKSRLAIASGLETTLLTQFFFEVQPFIDWVGESRAAGIGARLIGGLAGPARISTLLKFAMRCGVGSSIRALGSRPSSLTKLIREHGPEPVVRELAHARQSGLADFDGVHLFCFGGYLRTCEWLHKVANGRFELDPIKGFNLGQAKCK